MSITTITFSKLLKWIIVRNLTFLCIPGWHFSAFLFHQSNIFISSSLLRLCHSPVVSFVVPWHGSHPFSACSSFMLQSCKKWCHSFVALFSLSPLWVWQTDNIHDRSFVIYVRTLTFNCADIIIAQFSNFIVCFLSTDFKFHLMLF